MNIKLQDLDKGVPVKLFHTYTPSEENLDFKDQKFISPIEFQASGHLEGGCFIIDGKVSAEVECECGRCLEPFKNSISENVHLTLYTDGVDEIDITEDIREVLIFQHPIRSLCSEDCKGICAGCGINLNKAECCCSAESSIKH